MSDMIVHILIGLAGAYVFIRAAGRGGATTELRWYAGGLVIAAGVYVAFGLVLGGRPLGFELGQLATFVLVAVVGLRFGSSIIGAGWLAHAGWDALHVVPALSSHAPEWYVTACLVFDVVLGGYILVRHARFVDSDVVVAPSPKPVRPE